MGCVRYTRASVQLASSKMKRQFRSISLRTSQSFQSWRISHCVSVPVETQPTKKNKTKSNNNSSNTKKMIRNKERKWKFQTKTRKKPTKTKRKWGGKKEKTNKQTFACCRHFHSSPTGKNWDIRRRSGPISLSTRIWIKTPILQSVKLW